MRLVLASIATSILLTAAASSVARADQCQLVDSDVSDWAVKWLVKGASIISYCEPCNDKAPGAATTITKVDVKKDKSGNEVSINGKGVDLAYTYVQTGKWTYTNVAVLAGCPVQQVTTSLNTQKSSSKVATNGKMPPACQALINEYDKLARCDKLPQASRDAMKEGLKAMKDGWGDMSKMDKDTWRATDDACKQGLDGVKQAESAVGC